MQYVKHGDICLAYQCHGPVSGVPILLIMGLGMPSISWPPQLIQQFVLSGFRVITFDNRDSGYSSHLNARVNTFDGIKAIISTLLRRPVKAPYVLEDMAADAICVLDAVGVSSAYVFGISMGSMIAQVMALHYPQRVRGLIPVMTASGNPRTGLGRMRAIFALLSQPESVTDPDKIVIYLEKTLRAIGSPGHFYSPQFIRKVAEEMVKMNFTADSSTRQLLAILGSGDRREQLQKICVPTLVIHGRVDPLLPLRAGMEVAACIPGAHLCIVEGMGHDLPDDKIQEIVSQVVSFALKS